VTFIVLTDVYTEYDKLNRQVSKLQDAGQTPKVYIKAIAELEEFMNETLALQKVNPKKMNATNAKGLNAVKQKIKKNNKDYQTQIDAYRADKDAFMESDEEEEPAPKPKKTARFVDDTVDAMDDDDEGFATVGKGGRTLQFTPESIPKHLRSIMESRGKKNTDRMEQIKIMEKLNDIAVTPYQQIRVLLTLVSARFDLGSGAATSMPLEHWKAAEKELSTLLQVLETNHDYIVIENAEEWDDDEKPPVIEKGEKYIRIPGSIVSYVERLDDELTRSLQSIDPHTSEYIDRLTDEGALYNIIFRGMLYYEYLRKDSALEIPQDSINRIVMRRLEHVYFKVRWIVHLKKTALLHTKSLFLLTIIL
jgi:translation initiation factor 3 subunit C